MRRVLFFFCMLCSSLSLYADEFLQGSLTIAPSAVLHQDLNYRLFSDTVPEPQENSEENYRLRAVKLLLEQARFVLSGMLYGFRFEYVPYDSSREIEELFLLEPVALIPRGDPRLRVQQVVMEQGLYTLYLKYRLEPLQQQRLKHWNSVALKTGAGEGEAPIQEQQFLRLSLEQAVKEALRGYLRLREYSKPRRITGTVSLQEFPQVTFPSGTCRTRARIRFDLEDVEEWAGF